MNHKLRSWNKLFWLQKFFFSFSLSSADVNCVFKEKCLTQIEVPTASSLVKWTIVIRFFSILNYNRVYTMGNYEFQYLSYVPKYLRMLHLRKCMSNGFFNVSRATLFNYTWSLCDHHFKILPEGSLR